MSSWVSLARNDKGQLTVKGFIDFGVELTQPSHKWPRFLSFIWRLLRSSTNGIIIQSSFLATLTLPLRNIKCMVTLVGRAHTSLDKVGLTWRGWGSSSIDNQQRMSIISKSSVWANCRSLRLTRPTMEARDHCTFELPFARHRCLHAVLQWYTRNGM
jgi:hypothetical protein